MGIGNKKMMKGLAIKGFFLKMSNTIHNVYTRRDVFQKIKGIEFVQTDMAQFRRDASR